MTPPPILGQDDLVECLRWAAFKMCGRGEHENFASDAITMAIDLIEDLRQPTQSDALREENKRLREHLISALDTLKDAEVCDDNCGPCNEARAALGESK